MHFERGGYLRTCLFTHTFVTVLDTTHPTCSIRAAKVNLRLLARDDSRWKDEENVEIGRNRKCFLFIVHVRGDT